MSSSCVSEMDSAKDARDARCPICAGRLSRALRDVPDPATGQSFEIFRCARCGLGQTHPVPDNLAPYYLDYHGGRHGATANFCIRRRIRFLRSAAGPRKPGALLDIGCGDGSFLVAARRRGWEVQGTEFNPQAARQQGLAIFTDLAEIPAPARFDCITLWHSFEHLRDPLLTMRRIHSLLAPSGVLLLAVPDSAGLQAAFFGRRWFHLDVPRHLYHYSKNSLSTLLHATGFLPIRWRYQELEYDWLGWSQSALNCLLPTPNAFFHLLTGHATDCGPAERFLQYAGGIALTGLALPLLPVGSILGRGATLVVEARAEG